jgi:hypothetical protein
MGNLSGVVEDLTKELKRAQHDVQRFTAALVALESLSSKVQMGGAPCRPRPAKR